MKYRKFYDADSNNCLPDNSYYVDYSYGNEADIKKHLQMGKGHAANEGKQDNPGE